MRKFRTMITAHAGAEDTPANTMESIRILADCGADAIEVDVRLLNGVPVMTHDAPGEHCEPLLDCLAELARHDGLRVNLDMKEPGQTAAVAGLVRESGMSGRTILTGGVTDGELSEARNAGMEVWCNPDAAPGDAPLNERVAARGLEVINLSYRDVDEALLREPQRLSVWTVNEEADLRRFLAAGVRNITTRRPLLALRLRREMEESD